ncbi:MAG: F-box protein [Methylomonas sp.]|jgi:hypothetical protein|uniref:F-box protein n=1 Tax=Methylomonas sp. TaxID=418 RepID=UPI0025F683EF|nr:F-box protein [Methylomonas sp.]MCK9608528.1 F-box protein [Methylomonas sp.]
MDNFDNWRYILDMLDARSLARCARTCTVFRDYARDLFERKAKEAFNEMLLALPHLSYSYSEKPSESVANADLIARFGEWCPERCVDFADAFHEIQKNRPDAMYYSLLLSLPFITIMEFYLVPSIVESRGMPFLLRVVDNFIHDTRIVNFGYPDESNAWRRPRLMHAAMLVSKHITEQNVSLVLKWLTTMRGVNTVKIFNFAIQTAAEQENELLLEKVMSAVSSSSLHGKHDYFFPGHRLVLQIICKSIESIDKYGKYIYHGYIPDAVGIIAAECDVNRMCALAKFHPARVEGFAVFGALSIGKFEFAEQIIGMVDTLKDFHRRQLISVIQNFIAYQAKYDMDFGRTITIGSPEATARYAALRWILRTAEFQDKQHLISSANALLNEMWCLPFINEIVIFLKERGLLADNDFMEHNKEKFDDITRRVPEFANMLARAKAE